MMSNSVNGSSQRTAVTVETFQELRMPMDARISPDGRQVAFVLQEWVAGEQKQRGRIWVAYTEGGDARPFTSGSQSDGCPRWSPDGRQLAFISRRDADNKGDKGDKGDKEKEKMQVYVMPARGGEARRVCTMPNGASEIEWSPDGSRIAFLSLEGAEPKSEPKVNEPLRHQRLWTVRPESDTPEPVTPANLTIWNYAWSPDSKRFAVFYSEGPSETDWFKGQLGVVAARGGAVRQVARLTRQAGALTWTRDGRKIAYVSGEWSDRPLVGGDVFIVDADGGKPRNLTPGIMFSPSWLAEFQEGGHWLYAAWDGLTNSIGVLDEASGTLTPLSQDFYVGERHHPRLSPTADLRRFAVTHTDQQTPTDVYLGELAADGASIMWRRLTRLNSILEETLELAPTERISYESVDGWRIEALYTPPLHAEADKKPPLIVYVHGGPTSAYRDGWGDMTTQLLAANGYAVLRPNPRGGMGRGVAFADAVLGDMGGKDFQDVLRGVEYLVARGAVDGERVGIMGWSYGGFMSAWAVTQTTRFKAALMGAGVCDFHSFHAQASIADWDMRIIGAAPTENPEAYREKSAITYVKRVTTPTLVIHGEDDPFVPVNQAYAFYRALRERGVPTELAVYPREGHGLSERNHNRDMQERMLRWFKAYI